VNAEEIPTDARSLDEAAHPTTFRLHALAKHHGIYLIGGTRVPLGIRSPPVFPRARAAAATAAVARSPHPATARSHHPGNGAPTKGAVLDDGTGRCGALQRDCHPAHSRTCSHNLHTHLRMGWLPGSYPERDGDKVFNTCVAFDREGSILAKHRKVHLFDINVPGGIRFKESDTLSAGNTLTVIGAVGSVWGAVPV
jgi:predicted amidohydrolase